MKSFVFVQYCINLRREIKISLAGGHASSQQVRRYSRHRSFRHFDPGSLQILSEPRVELIQAPELQVRHGLLLVFDVSPSADLVSCWHLVN